MYLSFYGLKDEPFRLTPDPRYVHLSAPHQAALTVLLEGILYRKGLVTITGPIGTGKTTLLHTALQMLTDIPQQKMITRTAFIFNPTLSRDEFLEMMLEEFEITCSSTSKPKRLNALQQTLLETQQQKGTAVLFIDEAHLLSSELLEEIRLLGNADTHHEKLLQIVLSGQPELTALMNRKELSALRQRVAAQAFLRSFTFPEFCAYVDERLRFAGLSGASPFSGPALEAILPHTTGVPRLINLFCDACLAIGYKKQRKVIQPDIVEEAGAQLGLIEVSLVFSERDVVTFPAKGISRPDSIVDLLIERMKCKRSVAMR